jgi:hypothetical protein
MFFHLTEKSRNQKTGPIPVSTSTATTCPDECPLKKAGCYADAGPLGLFWRKVTEGKAGKAYSDFVQSIESLPTGQLWRHNQSGDLVPAADDKEQIDRESLQELISANAGKAGFTYTHYNPRHKNNAGTIKAANESGFTVNLSGNNFDHADELAGLDCGPVVSIAPLEYERRYKKQSGVVNWLETMAAYKERIAALGLRTNAGRKIVICPATFSDDVSCKSCALCQKQRDSIVAFPAHGVSKRKASAIAEAQSAPAYAIAAE